MPVTGHPPGTCPACLTLMHTALRDAGLTRHPLCELPLRRAAPDGCDVAGCDVTAERWPHGDYDLKHAQMMAPRRQWPELGIPLDGKPGVADATPGTRRAPAGQPGPARLVANATPEPEAG